MNLNKYLIIIRNLHDDREAVVIGGRVAEDVHDGAHLLYSVQTCDRRAHHLSGWGRGRAQRRKTQINKKGAVKRTTVRHF